MTVKRRLREGQFAMAVKVLVTSAVAAAPLCGCTDEYGYGEARGG
jgi:hypothetical protein